MKAPYWRNLQRKFEMGIISVPWFTKQIPVRVLVFVVALLVVFAGTPCSVQSRFTDSLLDAAFRTLPQEHDAKDYIVFRVKSRHPYTVYIVFHSKHRRVAWPGGGECYILRDSEVHEFRLRCRPGERICYGAWSGSTNWGVGRYGNNGCSACCNTCDGGQTDVIELVADGFAQNPSTSSTQNLFADSQNCNAVYSWAQGLVAAKRTFVKSQLGNPQRVKEYPANLHLCYDCILEDGTKGHVLLGGHGGWTAFWPAEVRLRRDCDCSSSNMNIQYR